MKTHLLFVCSRNRWRSPTAEALFRNHPRYDARSAGTEHGARIKVTAAHLGWADLIFCMERKHAERLRERFPDALAGKRIVTLRIPDDYGVHDPALIARLRAALPPYLEAGMDSAPAPP
ncbi:MAG: protein tyrosine phosphatase [Candidatus Didemnitutus sp.]|nr:protein tyrosine phosphatase [Candidatus Didemnitutus sp.]